MQELSNDKLIALLDLTSKFVGNKDVRQYLNHVNFQVTEDGKQYIQAANGHILCRVILSEYVKLELPYLIDITSVKNSVKIKNASVLNASDISQTYPDTNRLVPKDYKNSEKMPAFNAKYLATAFSALDKCGRSLLGEKFIGVKCEQFHDMQANVFSAEFCDKKIKVEIVIMPMRL